MQPLSGKRILLWIGLAILLPAGLFMGALMLDSLPSAAARPPESLQTIDEFREWKGIEVLGTGTFEAGGVTYTVMLGPPGRYLASGPAAYLFDSDGRFIDWTPDKGDIPTVKRRFNLSGPVTNFEIRNQ